MDYNEKTIQGQSWQRCCRIEIHNPYQQNPGIAFWEEVLMLADNKTIRLNTDSCSIPFDPAAEFDIYDPETLQPTGQKATHQQMYGLLFSAYMDTAKKRDAARDAAAQPGPTATTPIP